MQGLSLLGDSCYLQSFTSHGYEYVSVLITIFLPLSYSGNSIAYIMVNKLDALLCFRHLSESRFLLGALHRRSKFANFCHDLMQNHLS